MYKNVGFYFEECRNRAADFWYENIDHDENGLKEGPEALFSIQVFGVTSSSLVLLSFHSAPVEPEYEDDHHDGDQNDQDDQEDVGK